jgi:hypothetical protein
LGELPEGRFHNAGKLLVSVRGSIAEYMIAATCAWRIRTHAAIGV